MVHRAVRRAGALVLVTVAAMALTTGSASAAGGVEMMTADGHHLTGPAAVAEYRALRAQPSVNCGSCRKYVVISAQKMPFIARNISLAFHAGKPFVVHKVGPAQQVANRKASCGGFQNNYQGECDEYPFASTAEGGAGAHIAEVPPREQRCQGGTLSRQYAAQQITVGTEFAVIITDTAAIPSAPFTGSDPARPEGDSC